jgi:hypothetical protein
LCSDRRVKSSPVYVRGGTHSIREPSLESLSQNEFPHQKMGIDRATAGTENHSETYQRKERIRLPSRQGTSTRRLSDLTRMEFGAVQPTGSQLDRPGDSESESSCKPTPRKNTENRDSGPEHGAYDVGLHAEGGNRELGLATHCWKWCYSLQTHHRRHRNVETWSRTIKEVSLVDRSKQLRQIITALSMGTLEWDSLLCTYKAVFVDELLV